VRQFQTGEATCGIDLEYLGLADVKYLDGHAAVVAADLLEDGVEAGVELSPVLELGVRARVVRLTTHLLALRQHLPAAARPFRTHSPSTKRNLYYY